MHVTLVPWIAAAQELKTKPTQHSVKELLSIGIQPDILLCRTDRFLSHEIKARSRSSATSKNAAVIAAKDVASIYEVPLTFAQEGVDKLALKYLHIEAKNPTWPAGKTWCDRVYNPKDEVSIGIVGKYVEYEDSYKSLKEALVHGAARLQPEAARHLDRGRGAGDERPESCRAQLAGFDGILVPGGFGKRGIEGMLNAIRYARENKVPYFGICLGMQTACIEFARNVCGLAERQLQRVRSRHAAPHHLQTARTDRRGRDGRHHAPGRVDLHAAKPGSLAPGLRGRPRSANAIAIATSSTASTRRC